MKKVIRDYEEKMIHLKQKSLNGNRNIWKKAL